jgi:CO/xanthine dehydrogenase Mo-binding subunit
MAGKLKIVNQSVTRIDALDKATGKTKYTGDMELANMAYGKILRSPFPHAKVLSIDTKKSAGLLGVVTVLTRDDFRDIDPYFGPAMKDRPILAVDKVKHVGDPVAAVVAESETIAEEALELIEVEYEELPVVRGIDDAIKREPTIVHENLKLSGQFADLSKMQREEKTNIAHHFSYGRGDVEKGFKDADHVFEHTFTTQPIHHCNLEPHIAIAQWEGDELTVWTPCQNPFATRGELASVFNIPLSKVRIIVPFIGGGNGCKTYAKIEPLVAALARKAGRPVKVALTMEEAFQTNTKHATRFRLKTGVKKDGKLVARVCEIFWDTGAYADIGIRVTRKSGYTSPGPYRFRNLKVDSYSVYTNKVPAGALRGFGVPQTTWATEIQMDIMARKLGLDPIQFRLKNVLERGEEFATGDPVDCDFAGGLKKLEKAIQGWKKDPEKDQGIGISCFIKSTLSPSVSQAIVRLNRDASVTLLCGSTEMGQGSKTVLSQIVAEELGVSMDRVSVVETDTGRVPFDISTSSSRTTPLMGRAVHKASNDAKRQLLEMASETRDIPVELLELRDAKVFQEGSDEEGMPFEEILGQHLIGGEIIGVGTFRSELNPEVPQGAPTPFWEVAFAAALVEVDRETGDMKILRYVTIPDIGKMINPLLCRGQSEGSVLFGIGHALFEEMKYEDGQLINPNFVDYRLPRFSDYPGEVESIFIENEDGIGPHGAKGLGEGELIPVAPAIANAIYDAVGIRIYDLPITPEKILQALR